MRDRLRADGWVVIRTPASLGPADLVALRAGDRPRLVQVKSSARSAFADFRPLERAGLSELALEAGAEAWLVWWPTHGKLRWYAEAEWP